MIVAAILLCGTAAACRGVGESIAAGEAAERIRGQATAVGLWGDHDGWSVVQAPQRERGVVAEEEPTALL